MTAALSARHVRASALAAALAAALGCVATAALAQPPMPAAGVAPAAQPVAGDVRVSTLIGMEVRNPMGEQVGRVEDLVVDLSQQAVQFAVVSVGGFLGLNERLFPFPLNAMRPAPGNHLLLNVDRNQLLGAPGFPRDQWPGWNDPRFTLPGAQPPSGAAAARRQVVRATQFLDKDVNDRNGRDVGEVEDLVVNLASGQVRFVVVEMDLGWRHRERLVPMALPELALPAQPDADLALTVPREQLVQRPGFDASHWPDLNDPATLRRFGAPPESSTEKPSRSAR